MQLTPAVRNAINRHFYSLRTLLEEIEAQAKMECKKTTGYLVLSQELSSFGFIKLLEMLHYKGFPSELPPINRTNLEKIKTIIHKMERSIAEIFSLEILPKRMKCIEKWLE